MAALKLTQETVEAAVCPPGRKDALFFDKQVTGFGLRVTAKGGKSFLAQYSTPIGKRRVALGKFGVVTVEAARRQAKVVLGDAAKGIDPFAERKAAAEKQKAAAEADLRTVEWLISEWKERHLVDRAASYRKMAPARLRAALAEHLSKPAAGLTRDMAVKALDVVAEGAGPIAANRARAYARACFAWACKRGTLESSPFAMLPTPSQEVSRERVLSDAELARVWNATDRLTAAWRDLVRALILTGQRRSEIAGMEWTELSEDMSVFTIPAARSKNGIAHDVPMSPAMVELLKARPKLKDVRFVFSQGHDNAPNGFGRMKLALDAAARQPDTEGDPITPPMVAWTLHDLRRTMATGLQEMGVALPVTEAVLNHISGSRSGIVGIYQRHKYVAEKRNALNAWAARVLAAVDGVEPESNVVELRVAAG